VPRKKKDTKFVDPTIPETKSLDLGSSLNLETTSTLLDTEWNAVLIHRSNEWILQKWGNLCSCMVTRIASRDAYDMPVRWYHKIVFDFCYQQYDKYGDYYRILDNTFGNINTDGIREVR
jgi:hypothetical protein